MEKNLLEDLRLYMPSPATQASKTDAAATERQLSYLKNLGVEVHEALSKKEASQLIDETLERRRQASGQ